MEKTTRKKRSNKGLEDELELSHYVGSIYFWDVFIYIFICLWDKERYSLDYENRDLAFKLKSALKKLHQYRGTPDNAFHRADILLDNFMRSRRSKEHDDCDRYVRTAYSRMGYKKITLPKRFEATITNMSSDHRGSLMEVCIQQLRSRASTAKLVYTTMIDSASGMNLEDADEDLDTMEADNLDSLKYQASLSSLTNFRWTDDDDNNAVHLTEDINNFRLFLEDFTRVKGRDIMFYEQEARKLLEEYKCEEGENLKSTLSSVLTRRVLELVLNSIDEYFSQAEFETAIDVDMAAPDIDMGSSDKAADTRTNSNSENLEAEIVGATNQLTGMLDRFVDIRDGNDALSQVVSAQVRQRVHAILGFRGFSNENHRVITSITEKVNDLMNKYRSITDDAKLEQSEKDAVRVVRDIIRIFRFRLQAQEPVPAVKFIDAGEKFDGGLMESSADEKCRNARVELCWFPVISTDMDSKKRKTYSKARVLLKYSSEKEEEEYSHSERSESESESESKSSSGESADIDAAVDSSKVDNKTGAGIDSDIDDTIDVDDVNISKYDDANTRKYDDDNPSKYDDVNISKYDDGSSGDELNTEAQNVIVDNSTGNANE